ncbi:hypothetical protein E2C01_004500 [Portunus trituberculatus]|uniref:Uncharacterized protein n=1 Tax=Portunus trituberculatus TaxID=210409 RepID=A0A5B7CT54_PORTR|nr:hypothetical protein [Portunus trituberculatus]
MSVLTTSSRRQAAVAGPGSLWLALHHPGDPRPRDGQTSVGQTSITYRRPLRIQDQVTSSVRASG